MAFVPMTSQREPTSRAHDLGLRLKAEVDKFEAQYPGTKAEDLRVAATLAIGEAAMMRRPRHLWAAVTFGIAASLGMLCAVVSMAEGAMFRSLPLWPLAALLFVCGVTVGLSYKWIRSR